MKNKIAYILITLLFFTSCIVQSPKYTTLDKVIALQLGMTKAEVEQTLGVVPYDLKAYTDTSSIFIYVYRTVDRKTLSFDTKPTNGHKSKGKYVQLAVGYSKKKGTVISIESCSLCPDNLVTIDKIDLADFFTFVTVTLPVILIYIGLKK
jgi:hypothetical protein